MKSYLLTIREACATLILFVFLLSASFNLNAQTYDFKPGNTTYDVEFWLRADAVKYTGYDPQEGDPLTVWYDTKGNNHFGRASYSGTTYTVPYYSYDGMNFHQAVDFTFRSGSTSAQNQGRKLGSGNPFVTSNSKSYYTFYVSTVDTKNSATNACVVTLRAGRDANGSGWRGNGTSLWMESASGGNKYSSATGKNYGIGTTIRTNLGSGNTQYLYHNAKKTTVGYGRTGDYSEHVFLGNYGLTSGYFSGTIQEVFVLSKTGNTTIDDLELKKIHSYLAIKYGQTLDKTEQPDLYDTYGEKVWDSVLNDGYNNGIFGIARDFITLLHQKQSMNVDDKKLIAFKGDVLYRLNSENTSTLEPTEYLMFGNNGLEGKTAYAYSAGQEFANGTQLEIDIKVRQSLVYKTQFRKYATATKETITASLSPLVDADYILISGDNSFDPATTDLYKVTNGIVTGIEFSGAEYISFISLDKGPGGISDGLSMWLKADEDYTVTRNENGDVTAWKDFSSNGMDYEYNNSAQGTWTSNPGYKTSEPAMNYHPAIHFRKTGEFLSSSKSPFSIARPEYYTLISAVNIEDYPAAAAGEQTAYFMGFGARTTSTTNTGSGTDVARRPAIGITKVEGSNAAVARYHEATTSNSNQFVKGTKDLFNASATTISLHEIHLNSSGSGTLPTADKYILFESDGYGEKLTSASASAIAYLGSTNANVGPSAPSMLGTGSRPDRQLLGTMGEMIAYERALDSNEKQKIYSYMGLKYGITLDLDKTGPSASTTNYNYILSDDTPVWPGTSNSQYAKFHNNVAGIVRDDYAALNNKQARSTNTDAIVRIGIGNQLGADSDLTGLKKNMESIMWGNDGKGTGTGNDTKEISFSVNPDDNCLEMESRMRRVWMLDNTRTSENYTLLISAGGEQSTNIFPYYRSDYQVYLIIAKSADDLVENGNPGNWTMIPGKYVNGEHQFSYTIPANTNYLYFTFSGKILPETCPSCESEGTKTLDFPASIWNGQTLSHNYSSLDEINPTVSLSFVNQGTGTGEAKFYSGNPRGYSKNTLRITRTGASAPILRTKIALDKASKASFSIYEIDRRASLYDEVTVYGLCGTDDPDAAVDKYYPNLYYATNSQNSSYKIEGNKAIANSKTSAALSSTGRMNVEFSEPVETIIIDHKVTGAASGWKRIGLSPIDFTCSTSNPEVNSDGIAFRQGAPSEVLLCEDVQFTFKIFNSNCEEKVVSFSDLLPLGMYWVENSISFGEYNDNKGVKAVYNTNMTTGVSVLTIDKLYIPGGEELTFFATARFIPDMLAQQAMGITVPPGEYANNPIISYLDKSGTLANLGSCDLYSPGCEATIVNALASDIAIPLVTTMGTLPVKANYSEKDEITVYLTVGNYNTSAYTSIPLYVYFNEEFSYVDGSLSASSPSPYPFLKLTHGSVQFENDMPGMFYVNITNLPPNTSQTTYHTISFKLKAPNKENLVKDGSGVVLPLGIEYVIDSESDDICTSCLFTDSNGNISIPYQEPPVVVGKTHIITNAHSTTIIRR